MTSTQPTESRQRGPLLTTMLTILTIFQGLALILVLTTLGDQLDHGQEIEAVQGVGVLLVVVALVGLAGIWGRQRWAVYLFATLAVIGLITDLAVGVPPLLLLVRVVLLGVVFWAIANRWEIFG